MAFGNIIICRADEAEARAGDEKVVAVLSIEHPGAAEGHKGVAPRLKDKTQMILTFWDSETPVENGPDEAQVAAGIAFAVEQLKKGDVIIHCAAGKARSAALALGVLAAVYPRESDERLIGRLLEIRPIAAPNILVVEMADALTGRGGKLLEAVAAHEEISRRRMLAEQGRARWAETNPEKRGPGP